jgi:hypothetical protein
VSGYEWPDSGRDLRMTAWADHTIKVLIACSGTRGSAGMIAGGIHVDGTLVQIVPVALPISQGTVRGTVATAVHALGSLGNVGVLTAHSGPERMHVAAEEGEHGSKTPLFNSSGNQTA